MRHGWLRILAEVLVVFVGVYAAFALDEYRSQEEKNHRRIQILEALRKDFTSTQQVLDEVVPSGVAVIDSILAEYDAGNRPNIGHLGLNVSFRTGTWDAILAAGGVNLLDIDLILAVEEYYENIQALYEEAAEGRQMSAALILPVVDQGNSVFYEADGGKLKKKYRWYILLLQDYRTRIQQLHRQNGEILAMVGDRLEDA